MRTLACVFVLLALPGAVSAQQDPWLGRDKALHFGVGAVLGAVGYGIGALVFERRVHRVVVGLSISVGAGAAKELRDRRSGHPSWRDLTWTAAGGTSGVATAWLIDRARGQSGGRAVPATGAARTRLPVFATR